MTARDARQVARLSDLRVWADSRTVNEAMWERVVAQDPVPGASLSPGDAITITIGARPEVVVPDLRGRDEDEMVTAIRGLGLLPGRRVVRRSGAVPEGHIVRTRPRAGTTVPPGSRIAFVVAVAPEPHHKLDRHRAKRRPPRGLPPDAFISLPAKE